MVKKAKNLKESRGKKVKSKIPSHKDLLHHPAWPWVVLIIIILVVVLVYWVLIAPALRTVPPEVIASAREIAPVS